MKKIFLLLLMILTVSGCGGEEKAPVEPEKKSVEQTPAPTDKKILVVYFSRTGEEYSIGNITKGNTAIVAEMIAAKTGADTFEIKPAVAYPDAYEPCTEIAKKELESNARPALEKNIDNLAQYDTVFIGFPIWWGALPRVMMTFLEANDFSGKTIVPFCTHGGSGLAGTVREIKDACPNAKVLDGLAIVGKTAQNDSAAAEMEVDAWLSGLGY
ncbi:MAG: NAD(P)H-dependent oxidoreductase [Quinella sp. 3Q1]|nr:NAD(P)H-dependent oxidoreductase [Quinella sp. 3Q1]MBR3051589.1 NAD(P)H-dependent oxidoreductase [Selenomonadaceae bacterium]MBR6888484.1 NAD(P)H-dependent oxidoreductase [Selenomonadaceae bacterium]